MNVSVIAAAIGIILSISIAALVIYITTPSEFKFQPTTYYTTTDKSQNITQTQTAEKPNVVRPYIIQLNNTKINTSNTLSLLGLIANSSILQKLNSSLYLGLTNQNEVNNMSPLNSSLLFYTYPNLIVAHPDSVTYFYLYCQCSNNNTLIYTYNMTGWVEVVHDQYLGMKGDIQIYNVTLKILNVKPVTIILLPVYDVYNYQVQYITLIITPKG
ncbi:hypothetical protein [Sulfolobus acidocaldarius]|uniref:Uncharacterized protein n=4 Tax=Sulfolobus acidocaldarius TaxID=2285 RepID=Q4JC92_SULAC|nr:hypothetical protein [Sulfolobus acidocaldarius]AAY79587.1 hypothetical protein Saci_0167 [Sulfolobus acidocaldarius DSM 639]AGE70140.1 hypothetical protein SacN8_00795 [Sulfolobus acidocaldarius N8]AGE72415.1 hypothetical protein SacRon12I_00795 [Sulfolobus acidocaldarius Ron12/I]ALU29447.1 hypothetical protein ATY89_05455 [Sulfolobus acidocaldarius]ALU32176.1 hypothetical protein ATZ20_08475 [Sulfolobus acidocaldarius]